MLTLLLTSLALATPAEDLKIVHDALGLDDRTDFTRQPWEDDAEFLQKRFGDRALPLLAEVLPDYNHGWGAAQTLLVLDDKAGLPLIFASMPKSDRNVQNVGFGHALRRYKETGQVPVATQAHAAAVRVLQLEDGHADAQILALEVAGLTGSSSDHSLLEKWWRGAHYVPVWEGRLQRMARGALGRLGHVGAIDELIAALNEAAKDPQKLSMENNQVLADNVRKAAFTGETRMAPALCALLDFPLPKRDYDVIPAHIGVEASKALNAVRTDGPDSDDLSAWKGWCAGQRSE